MGETHIFVSYSRRDRIWVDEGEMGLIPWLARSLTPRGVRIWYDLELRKETGALFRERIREEIERSDYVILLISQEFLNSSFIRDFELPLIQERRQSHGLKIIPILVNYTAWNLAAGLEWLLDLQMLPSDDAPLIAHTSSSISQNQKYHEILESISAQILAHGEAADTEGGLGTPLDSPEAATADEDLSSVLFDDDGNFRQVDFSFDIGGVLLRAAKRKYLDGRKSIGGCDLTLGLIRIGSLTRTVLHGTGRDPDTIYHRLSELIGSRTSGDGRRASGGNGTDISELTRQEVIQHFVISRRDQFDRVALSILEGAAVKARNRRQGSATPTRVRERDVLESTVDSGLWEHCGGELLPVTSKVARVIDVLIRTGDIDADGVLDLRDLDAEARRTVRLAHLVAQKLGVKPITHRVLFAAFLLREGTYGEQRVRHNGGDPEKLAATMLNSFARAEPRTFPLNLEASERILLPVIRRARRDMDPGSLVDDKRLFEAFVAVAVPEFKRMVRAVSPTTDLDT